LNIESFQNYYHRFILIAFQGNYAEIKIALWCGLFLVIILKVFANRLSGRINLKKIDNMSGEDFEYCVAEILYKHGFKNVCVTAGSGDFGVDVIASYKKIKYAIQVKRYRGLVGIAAVQEAYSGAKYYEADSAIVITNSHFTDAARSLAKSCNVILMSRQSFLNASFIKDLNNI
jgi:HJR/Mrr/RecB family endonuclease